MRRSPNLRFCHVDSQVTGDKEEKPAAKAPAAPKTKAKASDKKAEPAAKKAKKK